MPAQAVAWRHGLSLEGHVARRLTRSLLQQTDLILVMEPTSSFHCRHGPGEPGKIAAIWTMAGNQDIPDPYRKSVKPLNMFSSNWESQSGMGSSFESTRNEALMSSNK
jgi:protein-tyrosine-phosphatase